MLWLPDLKIPAENYKMYGEGNLCSHTRIFGEQEIQTFVLSQSEGNFKKSCCVCVTDL